MSSIFGGSKSSQTSSSSNRAFDSLNQTFNPVTQNAASGANALAAFLGGDASGFNAYKKATGFDALTEQGSRGITGNAAAGGLLRSGSTGKALQDYGIRMQDQFAGNYMDRLMGQAGLGLQAGNLIAGAGQTSTSSGGSSNKPGIGGFLGAIGSGIAASDRRLKMDIENLGEIQEGLNLYRYKYIDGRGPFIGVMADEVEATIPEALGPVISGYKTVDYDKVKELTGHGV